MFDHFSLPVSDYARARAFYDVVLATLGHRCVMEQEEDDYIAGGYGDDADEPAFWVGAGKPADTIVPQYGQHIAFRAPSRAAVDAFHAAGLAAGGQDNGAPGLRPHYHANYYAAFLIDPDGHHLEAVCHRPD